MAHFATLVQLNNSDVYRGKITFAQTKTVLIVQTTSMVFFWSDVVTMNYIHCAKMLGVRFFCAS